MYLFFDTETNGLPKDWKAKMSNVENWPRIIQLGWQIYDSNRALVMESKELIVPDGWEIPNLKFWIDNGYSTAQNKLMGVPIHVSLGRFIQYYEMSKYMIAHNMDFDYNVVGAEMMRIKLGAKNRLERLCTMKSTTDFLKLPAKNGRGYKFPKLEELYRFLFKEEFDGAHDALADVKATARCFFELVDRGIIVLPK